MMDFTCCEMAMAIQERKHMLVFIRNLENHSLDLGKLEFL